MASTKFLAGLALAVGMSMGATSAMAAACTVNDILITNSLNAETPASGCAGEVTISGNSPTVVVDYANTNSIFTTDGVWTEVLRQNSGATTLTGDFGGLQFSLSGTTNTVGGAFTMTVTDLDPNTAPALPAKLDLMFTLKAGTGTSFYFFDNLSVDGSNPGTYNVTVTNNGGNFAALSDITLMARGPITDCQPGDPTCDPIRVPEPGSLALVGLAIAAAGFARRRKA
jgi:hypothetical protein